MYIEGLFLEGARWDSNGIARARDAVSKGLAHAGACNLPGGMKRHGEKVLNTGDVIQVRGVHHGEFDELYVLPVRLTTSMPQSYWIKRGTAIICCAPVPTHENLDQLRMLRENAGLNIERCDRYQRCGVAGAADGFIRRVSGGSSSSGPRKPADCALKEPQMLAPAQMNYE